MASIILPNQLFPEPIEEEKKYLIEHPKFFTQLDFHRKKLILHRASMKAYNEEIEAEYVESEEAEEKLKKIFSEEDEIKIYDPVDHEIREKLEQLAEEYNTELKFLKTPLFMTSQSWNQKYFQSHEYFQLNYYKKMRKKFDVLVDEEGKPEGGKWSFDPENRKKMPEDMEKPRTSSGQ